jgi:hypothetical protein
MSRNWASVSAAPPTARRRGPGGCSGRHHAGADRAGLQAHRRGLKRLHNRRRSKELRLLKERFKDDPEAFWRFNKRPTNAMAEGAVHQGAERLRPGAGERPEQPDRLHRQAKAEAYKQVVAMAPALFNQKKAALKYSQDMEITGR